MKFIKIPQHNNKDFHLINLSQIAYVACNDKSHTCKIFLTNKETITLFPQQTHSFLTQISEYNRQVVTYLMSEISEEDF